MSDVARLARVTPMTVSRALRTPSLVSRETLARVEAAIAKTGFVPNYVAGSLSSNHSRIIVAIVPTIMNSVFSGMIEGLSEVLRSRNYQLLLGSTNFDLDVEEKLLREFLGWRPAGIVVTGGKHTRGTRTMLTNSGVPVVETWHLDGEPLDVVVGFSNYSAAYEMARSLVGWGYRRIALIHISAQNNDRSAARRNGYRQALIDAGRKVDPNLECEVKFGVGAGRGAAARLLDANPDIDAIMCASDALAAGVLMECIRRGYRVPKDIAVTGFGDVELSAELVPSLTTVHLPRNEIGRRTGQVLLDRIAGEAPATTRFDCGFSIVRRDSA
jgi:LacI family gluconate utilization system Gnt-I transcriptional repressor